MSEVGNKKNVEVEISGRSFQYREMFKILALEWIDRANWLFSLKQIRDSRQ